MKKSVILTHIHLYFLQELHIVLLYSFFTKFGEKDIVSNEINYEFANLCRQNEDLCGNNGKYFEEEKNIDLKIVKHSIVSNLPISISLSLIFVSLMPLFLIR